MTEPNHSSSQASVAKRPVRKQLWFDLIARVIITSGGVGTLLVALLIVVVMISQLLPLLSKSESTVVSKFRLRESGLSSQTRSFETSELQSKDSESESVPLCVGLDEYGDIAWFLLPSGAIETYATATGQFLQSFPPPELDREDSQGGSRRITAYSVADDDASLMVGYADGSVRPITIEWQVEYLEEVAGNDVASTTLEGQEQRPTVFTQLPNGLVRVQSIASVINHDTIQALRAPVRCIDWLTPQAIYGLDKAKSWRWLASDGQEIVVQHHLRRRQGINPAIEEEVRDWRAKTESTVITAAMLNAQGNGVTTIDSRGLAQYWRVSPDSNLSLITSHWTITGSESSMLTSTSLLGRNTLLLSSEAGQIEGVTPFFGAKKTELLSIHRVTVGTKPVVEMAAATNSRLVSTIASDGQAALIYVPTNRRLLTWQEEPASHFFFSSGSRFLVTLNRLDVTISRLNLRFPEAGWRSFLGANWFEGYDQPRHLWQSSSGTIQGEIKLSIVPLLFGTIKGTFYTLIIAIPLGLLSAIFSSEYLHPTTRARVKPIMELMASVPSVALGFIGAVALAPLFRERLFGLILFVYMTLLFYISLPVIIAMLPRPAGRFANRYRTLVLIASVVISFLASNQLSEAFEFLLFGGPLNLWLNGEIGSIFPGWLCLLLLPCGIAVAWLGSHYQVLRRLSHRYAILRAETAVKSLITHLGFVALCVVVTCVLAMVFSLLGFDARGTFLGSYQERNALLVGIVLGFAIVPLIFTLSEDALQAVPQHLRAASMSCGATVWQTTVNVVIPTALSGLFSAVMLGLGRAIGETMVVLMVSGNSPIMESNPLSGFRTLSATLSAELPEAARGSTHYHALFFVAILLFFLTMVVNSIAEYVRLRFKRNASQL